ncbi:MAG: M56 family metallopeptidase [Candidatus Rokubacteria bacterium]|nr:M56 family metallopeptidase [Candidatus Rokubacteria bacterium]
MSTHPLTALALAFLSGSLLWATLRLAFSLVGGWWLGRRLSTYEPGEFPLLDRALGVAPEVDSTRIRISRSPAPQAFTIGLIRPKICLSRGLLEGMTETEILAVLRHEHAHVKARDPLRLAWVRLLADFLWFLPVSRALAGAFSGMAELRADDAALSAGSDSIELASAIAKTARGGVPAWHLAPALGGLALVEQRVMRLLGREPAIRARIPWGRGLASGLVVAALLTLLVGPTLRTAVAAREAPIAAMRPAMARMMATCSGGRTVDFSPQMAWHGCAGSANGSSKTAREPGA